MSFNVLITSDFKRDSKKLLKKFRSLKKDILELITSLELTPRQGISLGQDCYKLRLAIKSKGKGKSGGARIITCVKIHNKNVYMLCIYDKPDRENISDKELSKLINKL